MSGRGKGGKGLGKGGNMRHRKVLRDNIQGITKPALRRLARRGGVKRISGLIPEEMRSVLKVFLENVIRDSVTMTEHARRKTVSVSDVVYTLKRQGRPLWGICSPTRPSTEATKAKAYEKRFLAKLASDDWKIPSKYEVESDKQTVTFVRLTTNNIILKFPPFNANFNVYLSTGKQFLIKALDDSGKRKAMALDRALSYIDTPTPEGLVPFGLDEDNKIELMPALTPAYGNFTLDHCNELIDLMAALRDRQIFYFDLKLSNVLLDHGSVILGDVEEAYPKVRLLAHIYWACTTKAKQTECLALIRACKPRNTGVLVDDITPEQLVETTKETDYLRISVTHSPKDIEVLLKPLTNHGLVVGKRQPAGQILLSFKGVKDVSQALSAIQKAHTLLTQWALAMTALEAMFDTEDEYDKWAAKTVNKMNSTDELTVKKPGKEDWIKVARKVYAFGG